MRIGVVADNVLEKMVLAAGVVPTVMMETMLSPLIVRILITAVNLGMLDALAKEPLTADHVASICRTGPRATRALLDALLGMGYLERAGEQYALRKPARKWLVSSSAASLKGMFGMVELQWGWSARLEDFVRSDRPLTFTTVSWALASGRRTRKACVP